MMGNVGFFNLKIIEKVRHEGKRFYSILVGLPG